MIFRRLRNLGSFSLISSAIFLVQTVSAHAGMPEHLYKEALQIAQNKILRTQQNRAGALSSSVIKSLYGRYYQVGDSWDVIAWQFNRPFTPLKRSSTDPSSFDTRVGTAGIFHYEVVDLKNGINPQVTLQVTQKGSNQFPIVDPHVEHLYLVMSDQLIQSEKRYFFKNNAEVNKTKISPIELYPLDVPNIVTAEHIEPIPIPALPSQIRQIAKKIDFNPDLNRSFWYEQDDFFGRPVQVLWQQGDPWPSLIKTTNGIALLIHKGTL